MLRELNAEEMGMVSGGSEPPDWFNGPSWEWDWAESDPLVMAQLTGPAGYNGGYDGDEATGGVPIITAEFHDLVVTLGGDILNPVQVEASTVTINFTEMRRRLAEHFNTPQPGSGAPVDVDLSGCHNQCNY